jgi:hypothetical protein
MQKIAAYLLERREEMTSSAARATEATSLKGRITEWLKSKGASDTGCEGTYDAEDGSHATFRIEEASDDPRSWWMVRLEEVTEEARRFAAAISVTDAGNRVAVYATLEVGSGSTLINPVEVDPRCPKVVRTLLDAGGKWFHGASELRRLRHLDGFESGEQLAADIAGNDRTVPFIVISRDENGLVLPNLDERLAYDLAGLAIVVVADPDASWALTDNLGKSFSCYRGAVRLYWPKLSTTEDPYRHPLWTANRLRSNASDLSETLTRFRRQLRGLVMRASALSVVRPPEIDEVRTATSRRAFAEMKERASSLQDYKELADVYSEENERLRAAAASLHGQIEQLQTRTAEMEAERQALLTRVENAEVLLRYRPASAKEIAPDPASEVEDPAEPAPSEERFYKKAYSTPTHDVMTRVSDCGCDNWQGAHGADKAKKGIAKLENGRDDWKRVQHCASCTGGGMWRVRW